MPIKTPFLFHLAEVKDISWLRPDGKEMDDEEWEKGFQALALRLAGDAIEEADSRGRPIKDDTFLLLLNAYQDPVSFTLPAHKRGIRWELVFDTAVSVPPKSPRLFKGGQTYSVTGRTLALLCGHC